MRRYLLTLSCFALAGIVGLGLLSAYRFWILRDLDEADPRLGQLLRYQEEKIARLPAGTIDTVLIGDSSLGNGIDIRAFDAAAGVRASSLALTGNFGFAGGLELLRQLAERQPIRNVILIYSIDAMGSGAGHSGHFFVSPRPLVEGLTWDAQLGLLRIYATTLLNGRSATILGRKLLHGGISQDALPKELYADDYVIIDTQMALDRLGYRVPGRVKPRSAAYLKVIARLCAEKKWNCLYAHGPVLARALAASAHAHSYLVEADRAIEGAGIKVIANSPVELTDDERGDTVFHAGFSKRAEITRRYVDLLRSELSIPGR
jgi:hypothetical protein